MRILLTYAAFVIVGQAIAVVIGLLLDPYSQTLALAVFIPTYYAMYWVAWRITLLIVDRSPAMDPTEDRDGGGPGIKAASWLFAPAVVALDLCE
jgi:hypothetical protein